MMMFALLLSTAHALAYSIGAVENGAVEVSLQPDTRSAEVGADEQPSTRHHVVHRRIHNAINESLFANEFSTELSSESQGRPTTIEKNQIKADVDSVRDVLAREMADLSPEVHGQIASSIKSSKVDRSRYRDIFLIKKRIVSDGERRVVTFDIKERIFPKPGYYGFSRDALTTAVFGCVFILLLCLVLVVTVKMYRTVIAGQLNVELAAASKQYE
ncbi:hypothetical protein PAPHI01_2283 [Pancytospora philotis]|nr:hypothetical protein PAPHI01_2283 [Pancytospora philotis]